MGDYVYNSIDNLTVAINELTYEIETYEEQQDVNKPPYQESYQKYCAAKFLLDRERNCLDQMLKHIESLDCTKTYTLDELFGTKVSVIF